MDAEARREPFPGAGGELGAKVMFAALTSLKEILYERKHLDVPC